MTITDQHTTESTSTATWYETFFARVDALDITLADECLTEDTELTMANHPTVVGREAVRESMLHLYTMIHGMHHEFRRVIEDGDNATVEAICTYTRNDDSTVAIPVLTAVERRNGLVSAQRIYIDLAPLFDTAAV